MKLEIDIDAVIKQAVPHMQDDIDLRWTVGMALEELYPDVISQMHQRMVNAYNTNLS